MTAVAQYYKTFPIDSTNHLPVVEADQYHPVSDIFAAPAIHTQLMTLLLYLNPTEEELLDRCIKSQLRAAWKPALQRPTCPYHRQTSAAESPYLLRFPQKTLVDLLCLQRRLARGQTHTID